MFLKSLELNGFKSFASKTILEFPGGITAIVGPNGSGKSNIIDAIRWLLGEREAKNLRGVKAENLIFAGTPKKPRLALASAGLVFDNSAGFIKDHFGEISVVRRVNRDGISQYFLNKSESRLKDIIDFFAKARLGVKGLTIINQGSSDLFVRATPSERKIMIEEALGLREFQLKKTEAERKLEATAVNLDKAKAMADEVLPRLRMLKRQTAKFLRRAEIEKELKNLEDGYYSFKIGDILKEKESFGPVFGDLEKQIALSRKELLEAENEVKKIEEKSKRRNFEEIKSKKSDLSANYLNLQKELGRVEAKLEFFENSEVSAGAFEKEELISLLKETKSVLDECFGLSDFKEVVSALKVLSVKIEEFFKKPSLREKEKFGELEKLKNIFIEKIAAAENELKKIEKEESEIASGLEEFNKSFQAAFERFEKKKDEIAALKNKKQRIAFEIERIELKLNDIENQLRQIGRNINEIINNKQRAASEANFNGEAVHETERKMLRLRGELASIGDIDQSLLKEAEETEKHYDFLSSQAADLEKASADLKILINELKEKIHLEFKGAFESINEKFNYFFRLMFGGGSAKLKLKTYDLRPATDNNEESLENDNELSEAEEREERIGVEIDLNLPRKKAANLEMLSGGEKSLVSIAALFALTSVSPPPFLVLDEIDAALDEKNSRRFADLVADFAHQTQFIIVTHNRAVMEKADVLYGITVAEDGTSKLLSLKLEGAS